MTVSSSGSSSGSSSAERLAAAVGAAAGMLGVRADPSAITAPVFQAVREPLEDYHRQLNWPSALNDCGPPVEVSLKLDRPDSVALRCVVDVTDHHHGPAGNWQRYLAHSPIN